MAIKKGVDSKKRRHKLNKLDFAKNATTLSHHEAIPQIQLDSGKYERIFHRLRTKSLIFTD